MIVELVKPPSSYLIKSRKVGWSDKAGGSCVRVGGTLENTLKEGRGNKDFRKGGQAGSRGGCLKNGEHLEPLYKLCFCMLYLELQVKKKGNSLHKIALNIQ